MSNTIEHTKKELLESLAKTRGIVTTACEQIGISRSTYYAYYNDDKVFAKAVDDLSNVALDFAESKLFEKMEGVQMGKNTQDGLLVYSTPPSDTALIFYLKTKGKKRGYIEKQEIDIQGGVSLITFEDAVKKK